MCHHQTKNTFQVRKGQGKLLHRNRQFQLGMRNIEKVLGLVHRFRDGTLLDRWLSYRLDNDVQPGISDMLSDLT